MRMGRHIFQRALVYGLGGLLLALAPMSSNAQTTLGTQTLALNLQPAGLLYTVPASVSLTHTGTTFTAFTGRRHARLPGADHCFNGQWNDHRQGDYGFHLRVRRAVHRHPAHARAML